jgi:hypothetical protein
MNDTEKQLNLLMKIRKMRVENVRREHKSIENHIQSQINEVDKTQRLMEQVHRENIAKEKETLAAMINVESLKLSKVVGFVKLQQHGVKRLGDGKRYTETVQKDIEESKDNLAVCGAKLVQAEKKLLVLEEVVDEKLWMQK